MTSDEPLSAASNPSQPQGEAESTNAPAERQEAVERPSRRWLARLAAIVLLLGVCSAAIWYWGFHEPEPKDDLGRFQGEWKLTINGRGRKGADESEPPRMARVVGDRLYLEAGKEGRYFRVTLNETVSPKEIELTLHDAGGKPVGAYGSHGIYAVDRKTARIAVEPANKPRPKDFDNPDAVVWVLSR